MAAGDIAACRILATGWEAEIDIAGLSAGGTYAMDGSGATLTDTSTAKVVFTVVSEGYSAAGVLGTKTRTVYGTRARQKAYPNQATAEESIADGTLTVTLALSDYIYDDDNTGEGKSGTAPTVTIGAGFYTEAVGDGGTANNAATDLAVTNNSTQDYPKVIARWAVVPYQRVVSTLDIEVVAFHRFAENGKPVACVVFSHTDASTDAVASTTMVKSSAADSLPCYKRTITASGYTDDTVYNWQFTAYPWVGDADSVMTSVGGDVNALTLGPLPLLMDSDDDYGVTYAYVNTATGNDGTGAASRTASTAEASPFATVRAAAAAIQVVNNAAGRNNADCGVIRLQSNNHSWGDGSGTATVTNSWLTVTRDPNVSKANACIVGNPNGSVAAGLIRVYDLTLVPTGYIFNGGTTRTIWMDHVDTVPASQVSTQTVSAFVLTYNTFCTSTLLDYPWANYGAASISALTRGCVATEAKGLVSSTVTNGPRVLLTTTITHGDGFTNGTFASCPAENTITAYCKDWNHPDGPCIYQHLSNTAFVCNVSELVTYNGSNISYHAAPSGTVSTDNVLVWHNTMAGERSIVGYNETTGEQHTLSNLSVKYNSMQFLATKHDEFAEDGNLIGAWSALYGVGWVGNNSERTPDTFYPNWNGLTGTRATAAGYTDDHSLTGDETGGGDYTPASGSVLIGKIPSAAFVVIPWDINGTAYVAGGSAGAYEGAPAPLGGGGYRFWTYS